MIQVSGAIRNQMEQPAQPLRRGDTISGVVQYCIEECAFECANNANLGVINIGKIDTFGTTELGTED